MKAVGHVCWLADKRTPDELRLALSGPGLRLSTIHAAKGLEFRVVILAALDLLPNPMERDEALDSRLLYVALTRATDELVVTWAGRSGFTDRVERASKAMPLEH